MTKQHVYWLYVSKLIIYFDNAATTFPKPEAVYVAQDRYFRNSGNPGRGAHALALESARKIFETRKNIASFLGIPCAERLLFTPGCTYSINFVLKGLAMRKSKVVRKTSENLTDENLHSPIRSGSIVLTSALEHNAVMRPLRQLEQSLGIKVHALPYARQGVVAADDLRKAVDQFNPALCLCTEASNVTGEVVDISMVAQICHEKSVPLLVDAAQSAGRIQAPVAMDGISFWCASSHKGLMGPPGVGLLYVHEDYELTPLVSGGTGSASENLDMPEVFPDHMEAGTMAGQVIAALGAGVQWLEQTSVQQIIEHETALANKFLFWCWEQDGIEVYGSGRQQPVEALHPASAMPHAIPVVSFNLKRLSSDRVADMLNREFGIAVRAGLHCAALAHKTLGTLNQGTVRASFGWFNTKDEVEILCDALATIID